MSAELRLKRIISPFMLSELEWINNRTYLVTKVMTWTHSLKITKRSLVVLQTPFAPLFATNSNEPILSITCSRTMRDLTRATLYDGYIWCTGLTGNTAIDSSIALLIDNKHDLQKWLSNESKKSEAVSSNFRKNLVFSATSVNAKSTGFSSYKPTPKDKGEFLHFSL